MEKREPVRGPSRLFGVDQYKRGTDSQQGGASLAKASDALRYLVERRPFGKVVLTI